jgi:hypothetical protein
LSRRTPISGDRVGCALRRVLFCKNKIYSEAGRGSYRCWNIGGAFDRFAAFPDVFNDKGGREGARGSPLPPCPFRVPYPTGVVSEKISSYCQISPTFSASVSFQMKLKPLRGGQDQPERFAYLRSLQCNSSALHDFGTRFRRLLRSFWKAKNGGRRAWASPPGMSGGSPIPHSYDRQERRGVTGHFEKTGKTVRVSLGMQPFYAATSPSTGSLSATGRVQTRA